MKTIIKKGISAFMTVVMLAGILAVTQPGVTTEAKTRISRTKATICTGETLQLALNSTKKIKWKTSKKSIAVVDKNGLVTGKKKGNCVIKASSGGKNYSCKVKVNHLPKSYATVNGKKVKVGKEIKITYKLTAPVPVSDVSVRYFFYGNQIQIVTSSDDKMRFKTWVFFNGYDEAMELQDDMLTEYESQFKRMKKGIMPMMSFHQCGGVNENKDNTESVPVSCKKGKEFDSFYIKVLAHGNFSFKAAFEVSYKGETVKKYTMTEKIK